MLRKLLTLFIYVYTMYNIFCFFFFIFSCCCFCCSWYSFLHSFLFFLMTLIHLPNINTRTEWLLLLTVNVRETENMCVYVWIKSRTPYKIGMNSTLFCLVSQFFYTVCMFICCCCHCYCQWFSYVVRNIK